MTTHSHSVTVASSDVTLAPARNNPSPTPSLAGALWTHDRIARLQKLWRDGHSASEIAAELGGVSRSAVIGKVHRLGLAGRRVLQRKPKSSGRKLDRKERSRRMFVAGIPERLARRRERAEAGMDNGLSLKIARADAPEPYGPWLHLTLLNSSTCRWPQGDPKQPDFGFCGAPINGEHPYCGYHTKLAYRPPPDRAGSKKEYPPRISFL